MTKRVSLTNVSIGHGSVTADFNVSNCCALYFQTDGDVFNFFKEIAAYADYRISRDIRDGIGYQEQAIIPPKNILEDRILPDVGDVCRILRFSSSGKWVECDYLYRIDYIGERVVVATTVDSPRKVERVFDEMVKFIPVNTEEERQIREMNHIITNVIEPHGCSDLKRFSSQCAKKLWEDGFSKDMES